jgi:hypothetical protein
VVFRAFVTICISPLAVVNVQCDKAGDQYGHLELPDDSFESGKPKGRPAKREHISIGHRGERHKTQKRSFHNKLVFMLFQVRFSTAKWS